MELKKSQINFLNKYTKGSWTFNNKTGLVDIDGDFDFSRSREGYPFIPREGGLKDLKGVRFGVVTGHFKCKYNSLTSLEGAPQEVGWCFDCSHNKITSLEGAPKEVGGYFDCYWNNLTSLEGAPKKVGRGFDCHFNKLTSLVGAPQEVGGCFNCSYNKIVSLEGAPQEAGWGFYLEDNPISPKTLNLVLDTMQEKKVDYVGALLILNTKIPKSYWSKMIRGYEDKITPEAIKTYAIASRYSL